MPQNHPFDVWLLRSINIGLGHPFLDPVMRFFSSDEIWMVVAAGLLWWTAKHFNRRTVVLLFSLIVAVVLTDFLCHSAIKVIFARERGRPCFILPWVRLVMPKCGNWFSFPSNHAANSMCVAAFIVKMTPSKSGGRLAVLIAALIGFSRIYVGVHFPSDVMAGASLGAFFGILFFHLGSRFDSWLQARALTTKQRTVH